MEFFEDFDLMSVPASGGSIRLRRAGDGPPLLLVHGNPQTHAMWHAVAPALAERFTIVCPDLRGYGKSFKPPATADHAPYAKTEMARDLVEVMAHCGFRQFAVAGHDRGARVAHRLALDFSGCLSKLALLDIIPTVEHFERADMDFALGYYHWFWLAQPHPFPETLINAAPDDWFRAHTSREPKGDDFFHPAALADYLDCVRDPEMIRGMCEDYRAAAGIDLEDDRASRSEGKKIDCPLLVLWGEKGKIEEWYDPLAVWRSYASGSVDGSVLPCGHYLAEEVPDAVISAFTSFFD